MVDVTQYKISKGDEDYPEKYNAMIDGLQSEILGTTGLLSDVHTAKDEAVQATEAAEADAVAATTAAKNNALSETETAKNEAITELEAINQIAYKDAVEAASAGKNTVVFDAQGNPNVMVWMNNFNCEDVNAAILARHGWDPQLGTGVFPAFIKNGVQIRGFWYGKYAASNGANGGCSVLPGVYPKVSINYDTAKSLCTNKGAGWHLAANIEWMAVAYLSIAYGEQPRGDTYYGLAHDARHETAKRNSATHAPGDTAYSASSLTGTGPETWSHDGTRFGVFDLVGIVWEWVDQLKLQEGQIFAPNDNNPDLAEASWPSHECYFDSSGATSGSIILNSEITNRTGDIGDDGNGNDSNSSTWSTSSSDASYIKNTLMRQLGIEPASSSSFNGRLYSRNFGERLPRRGGAWNDGSNAGLGALYFNGARTSVYNIFGFRPALFES
jgi:hypothetical protein